MQTSGQNELKLIGITENMSPFYLPAVLHLGVVVFPEGWAWLHIEVLLVQEASAVAFDLLVWIVLVCYSRVYSIVLKVFFHADSSDIVGRSWFWNLRPVEACLEWGVEGMVPFALSGWLLSGNCQSGQCGVSGCKLSKTWAFCQLPLVETHKWHMNYSRPT